MNTAGMRRRGAAAAYGKKLLPGAEIPASDPHKLYIIGVPGGFIRPKAAPGADDYRGRDRGPSRSFAGFVCMIINRRVRETEFGRETYWGEFGGSD